MERKDGVTKGDNWKGIALARIFTNIFKWLYVNCNYSVYDTGTLYW